MSSALRLAQTSPVLSLSPDAVFGFLQLRINQYFQAPSICLLAYDFLLTLPDEVEFMWRKGLTVLDVLFFLNRYMPFLDRVIGLLPIFIPQPKSLQLTCETLFLVHAWLLALGVNIADCILILRTYAIWDRNRIIAGCLLSALLGAFAVEGFFGTKVMTSFVFIESPSPSQYPGCFAGFVNAAPATFVWLTMLLLETVVFAFTLFKLLYQRKTTYGKPSVLFKTLLRDGVMFYAVMFGISLINIIFLRVVPAQSGLALTSFHRVLHSIIATRLVLNIRRAAASPQASTDQVEEIELSRPPVFARNAAATHQESVESWI